MPPTLYSSTVGLSEGCWDDRDGQGPLTQSLSENATAGLPASLLPLLLCRAPLWRMALLFPVGFHHLHGLYHGGEGLHRRLSVCRVAGSSGKRHCWNSTIPVPQE